MRNAPARVAQLREAEQRIAWIERHAGFSDWLKVTVRSAVERNPVDVINDLEILTHVLRSWATAAIDINRWAPEAGPSEGPDEDSRLND